MRPALIAAGTAMLLVGCSTTATTHHAAASSPTIPVGTVNPALWGTQPPLTCKSGGLPVRLRPVLRDLRREDKTLRRNTGPNHLPDALLEQSIAGAWAGPGAYTHDLKRFISGVNAWAKIAKATFSGAQGTVLNPQYPSQPFTLTPGISKLQTDGEVLLNDDTPGSSTPNPTAAQWLRFRHDAEVIAADC